MKATRAPSKKASLVGQGVGVRVGISVGVGVPVGSFGVGVCVGDDGNLVAVIGMGVVVRSGGGEVLITSVFKTSVVLMGSSCEHETMKTLKSPIHNHLTIHFATILFSVFPGQAVGLITQQF